MHRHHHTQQGHTGSITGDADATATYHVTACSNCRAHWIVTDLNQQDTCTCPQCGYTRNTDRHVSLATADDRGTAAELRAQLLADNAGELTEYKDNGSYRDHDTETSDVPIGTDVYDTLVEHNLNQHRNQYNDLVDTHPICTDTLENTAERVLGTVGQDDIATHTTDHDHQTDLELPDPHHLEYNADDTDNGDNITLPVNSDTGLTITQQTPVEPTVEIRGDQPVTDVWYDLLTNPDIQRTLIQSVRELGRNATYDELHDHLTRIGLTDTPRTASYRGLIVNICHGHENKAWEFISEARTLGSGNTTTDTLIATSNLFRYTEHTDHDSPPVVTVSIQHDTIRSLSRSQRTDVCQLLSILSHGLDIRIVTGRVTAAWLRHQHRDDLTGVNNWDTTHRGSDDLDTALTTLSPDGLPVAILRQLHTEPGGTMTYSQLYSVTQHSDSRVRQCLTTLSDLHLIETYGSSNNKRVEPRPEARTVISELDAVHGQQTTLSTKTDRVNEPPKSQIQRRVPAVAARGQEVSNDRTGNDSTATADRTAPSNAGVDGGSAGGEDRRPWRTVYMPRWKHDAIAGAAGSGGITVVNTGCEVERSDQTQYVSVLPGRGEVAVSVSASSPISYTVGSAVALTSPLVIERALMDEVVEDLVDDVPVAILRLARQIGGVTMDSVADPESFRDVFIEWGESIAEKSKALTHGEYGECESRDEFLSELLQDAHGLYGSIAHVLDAAGYDVMRDVTVPSTVGSSNRIEGVAESIAHSIIVQSTYKSFAAYRQLFEDRQEKRDASFTAKVDAADPVGDVIGGMVVRGGSGHRLLEPLQQQFESFGEHPDAPEFNVPVSIHDGVDRSDVAATVSRVLSRKGFRVNERCVSAVYGVLQSPFGAAWALRWLGHGDPGECVSIQDVRYAVEQVGVEWLLPRLPASAGRIVDAVLDVSGSVTVGGIADAAGVSRQTVRNYRDVLVATGVVETRSNGWRVVFGDRDVSVDSDLDSSPGPSSGPGPSPGSGRGRGGRGVGWGRVVERVESVCRGGSCGSSTVWVMVAAALLRPQAVSDVTDGMRGSGARGAGVGSSTVTVDVGPSVVQASAVAYGGPGDSSDGDGFGDNDDDDDDDGDGAGSGVSDGGGASSGDIELDFAGVSISGATDNASA